MGHVFISYSRRDQEYARKLADDLREHDVEPWLDDRIDFGNRWWRTIVKAIRGCAAFVVVMTPESEESEWVEREILLAQRERKPILPLLLRGKGHSLLITTQHADVTSGRMPPKAFYDLLRRALRMSESAPEAPVIEPAPDERKKQSRRDWLHRARNPEDLAFLTIDEMAALHSDAPTQKKNELVATAVRRALPTSTLLKVTNLEVVELRGRKVTYLTPNREMKSASFRDWVPGWRAKGLFDFAGRKAEFPLYFLWEGMYPICLLNTDASRDSEFEFRTEHIAASKTWLTPNQVNEYHKLARLFEEGSQESENNA